MIEFDQKITEAEYKKAITIHYIGYKYTLINPVLAVLILVSLGVVYFTIPNMVNSMFFVLLALGVYLLARPFIYVYGIYQVIKSTKHAFNRMNIIITDDDRFITKANGDESSFSLKNLYAYSDKKNFIYLYPSKGQFFLLSKRFMEANEVKAVLNSVRRLDIKPK